MIGSGCSHAIVLYCNNLLTKHVTYNINIMHSILKGQNAMLCFVMRCNDLQYNTMFCYVCILALQFLTWYKMQCFELVWNAMFCNAIQCIGRTH